MSRVWTKFKDSHAGGYLKIDKTEAIFIEAPQDEAINVFYNRFGVNPNQVSCTCCGDDYTIYETDESEIDDLGTYPAIVIKTYDIAPHEREGQVPVSGYVWKSGEDSGKRTIEQIAQAWENMGRKKIDNLFKSIKESKNRDFYRLIFALGIPNIGIETAKWITNKFNNFSETDRFLILIYFSFILTHLPHLSVYLRDLLLR